VIVGVAAITILENELVDVAHRLGRLPTENREVDVAAGGMRDARAEERTRCDRTRKQISHVFDPPPIPVAFAGLDAPPALF
jgi:hypothetical protein